MRIRILGAHNCESANTGMASLLVDGVLALDAGALTGSLSLAAQQRLQALLLTHHHYDHLRDVPALAMNFRLRGTILNLYATRSTRDVLATHLLNGELYPDFLARPTENPTLNFTALEAGHPLRIGNYHVLPVAVNHAIPTVGYQVTSRSGATIFYTGDTGPGLEDCWRQVSPQVLFVEVTTPNRYEEFAREAGHLTPALLARELACFRKIRGYLPQVVALHMNPLQEAEITAEINTVARSLGGSITPGRRGMRIHLNPAGS